MAKDHRMVFGAPPILLFLLLLAAMPVGTAAESPGPVRINPPPADLAGKTVLLRWNGKYNGDKFLARIGEMLASNGKGIRIIRLWEIDPSTAATSRNAEASEGVAAKIAGWKPDLVVAAQAD